jgi:hypothetical protein
MRSFNLSSSILCLATCAFAQPVAERITSHIRSEDLKADVAFLASDTLQGRDTPSLGLDAAAEYIASQMRKAGLEPVGDDGYFQTATFRQVVLNQSDLAFSLGGATSAGAISVYSGGPLDLTGASAFKITPAELPTLKAGQVNGKVLIIDAVVPPGTPIPQFSIPRPSGNFAPALIVGVLREDPGPRNSILQPPTAPLTTQPILIVWGSPVRDAVTSAGPGPMSATVSVHIGVPKTSIVKLRNVAGLLRGTDPQLKDTYVVVSAHHDHVGVGEGVNGDRIFNGADDDASGTGTVIEIAAAIASLPEKPKRSILFLTFFGEENGFLGSGYYTTHPIFPLDKTIVDLNLEVLGRTDDLEGPTPRQLFVTGYDYTDMTPAIVRAGAATGIKIVKHPVKSETFYGRGDSISFARAGVPAATVGATFEYPDLHKPSDEWQKLDYENMARLDRCIGLAIWDIANTDKAPQWNRDNPKTARFVEAFDKLMVRRP